MLLVGFAVASYWIIVAPDDKARLLRVQISAPFGVFGGAVVTFCTIVWRGLISKRQADAQLKATNLQREQIDKLALQIAATEENHLASLLQKGAELIADPDQLAHVGAGLATLRAVATDRNPKFAIEAMNLIADFINGRLNPDELTPLFLAAMEALAAGSDLGRFANRSLSFEASVDDRPFNDWPIVRGVRVVSYRGGSVSVEGEVFDRKRYPKFRFEYVRFLSGVADLTSASHFECEFKEVRIIASETYHLRNNEFVRCDFSRSRIKGEARFKDLRPGENYFDADYPPIFDANVDPKSFLHQGRPFEEDEIPF